MRQDTKVTKFQIWDAKMCHPDRHVYLRSDVDEAVKLYLDAYNTPGLHTDLVEGFVKTRSEWLQQKQPYKQIMYIKTTLRAEWREFLFNHIFGITDSAKGKER